MPEPTDTPSRAALDEVAEHVRSSANLLGLPLDAAQVERVALHLSRTRLLAAALSAVALLPEVEPAEIFSPAPFPMADPPAADPPR